MHYSDDALAQIIWDFNVQLDHVEPADVILAMGSHDLGVARRAVELFQAGLAPRILFTGGYGRLTDNTWTKPEAEMFAQVAVSAGVPPEKILIENQSTNTGENVTFSWRLLQKHGPTPTSVIVVQKPTMLQRARATFAKQLPDVTLYVTAQQVVYAEYVDSWISKKDVITIMVGDLQRLMLYAAKGFQIEVEIPPQVKMAYEELVQRGYTQQLLAER